MKKIFRKTLYEANLETSEYLDDEKALQDEENFLHGYFDFVLCLNSLNFWIMDYGKYYDLNEDIENKEEIIVNQFHNIQRYREEGK